MFTAYTKSDLDSRTPDGQNKPFETPENDLADRYQLEKCAKWIRENNYQFPCLQFPQSLLNDGTSIALHLQEVLGKVVYILGDTSYGSCCVDEVAAEHVNGDSIIHFGHACLSPVTKLPVLYIFEKKDLDLTRLQEAFQVFDDDTPVIVFFSDVYHHLQYKIQGLLEKRKNTHLSSLTIDYVGDGSEKTICGRVLVGPVGSGTSAVYIGDDSVTLQNLVLALPDLKWYQYTEDDSLVDYRMNRNKFLMQRMHLVEKIREASVIGILIGTLGIKNYLEATDRIKELAKKKGKKCYIMAVGKPNVPKLANFPEIDVFVYVACLENGLLKDFKDYYKPVVSLFEVEMALGDRPYSVEYTADFRELLPGGAFYKKIESADVPPDESSTDLLEKNPGTVIEYAGARYLSSRSWRGLEQNLGSTPVEKAARGRSGLPQAYENELTTLREENDS